MERWKSHVRAQLFQRDCVQKDPFSGLFVKVSKLEERLSLYLSLVEDFERDCSSNENGILKWPVDKGISPALHVQLKEGELVRQGLVQKVSDLTSVLYLKEAELQYCHSQVSRYRNEAVLLAKGASSLKNELSEYEYRLECQAKELAALRLEQNWLKKELASTCQEKEELLERCLEEKREEAERLNKHNDTQERWNRFAGRVNKRLRGGPRRHTCSSTVDPQTIQALTDQPPAKHE